MKNLSLFLVLFALLINSCGGEKEGNDRFNSKYDLIKEGELTVYCENSSYKLMTEPFEMYKNSYPKVDLKVIETSTGEAMIKLLGGECDVAIVSRPYTEQEDSLMQLYDVQTHKKMLLCEDALVFFVKKDFPIDTINENQLKMIMREGKNISDIFEEIKTEPIFVMNDVYSSEYENLKTFLTNRKMPKKRIKMFNNPDSVINFVKENDAVGIGYYSQIVGNKELKALKVGFTYYKGMFAVDGRYADSTGKYRKADEVKTDAGTYRKPRLVHQANIVRRYTPFVVKHEAYLFEQDRKNTAWWFATYIEKEQIVQKYFLDAGIVPGFARFKLIKED